MQILYPIMYCSVFPWNPIIFVRRESNFYFLSAAHVFLNSLQKIILMQEVKIIHMGLTSCAFLCVKNHSPVLCIVHCLTAVASNILSSIKIIFSPQKSKSNTSYCVMAGSRRLLLVIFLS